MLYGLMRQDERARTMPASCWSCLRLTDCKGDYGESCPYRTTLKQYEAMMGECSVYMRSCFLQGIWANYPPERGRWEIYL